MDEMQEEKDIHDQISDAISRPIGDPFDDVRRFLKFPTSFFSTRFLPFFTFSPVFDFYTLPIPVLFLADVLVSYRVISCRGRLLTGRAAPGASRARGAGAGGTGPARPRASRTGAVHRPPEHHRVQPALGAHRRDQGTCGASLSLSRHFTVTLWMSFVASTYLSYSSCTSSPVFHSFRATARPQIHQNRKKTAHCENYKHPCWHNCTTFDYPTFFFPPSTTSTYFNNPCLVSRASCVLTINRKSSVRIYFEV
jgi:hypothetical protein